MEAQLASMCEDVDESPSYPTDSKFAAWSRSIYYTKLGQWRTSKLFKFTTPLHYEGTLKTLALTS